MKISPKTYRAWRDMQTRCDNTSHPSYAYYGGRGITYPVEWKTVVGFARDMGDAPEGLCLDRIDNAGNYSPTNCRWTTQKINNQNSGRVKLSQEAILHIRASAGKVPVSALAQQYGVNRRTIWTAQPQRTWSNA